MKRENRSINEKSNGVNTALFLTAVFAVAVVVRVVPYTTLPFVTGNDDAFLALTAIPHRLAEPESWSLSQSLLLDGHNPEANEPISPAANLLLGASYGAWGIGEWQARLPSILCAAGCVLAIYRLVGRCGGRPLGLFAAITLAVAPLAVLGSRSVGGTAVAWLAMVLALRFDQRYRTAGVLIDLLRAAFFALVAALAFVPAIAFLPVLGLWTLFRGPSRLAVALVYLLALGAGAAFYLAVPHQSEALTGAIGFSPLTAPEGIVSTLGARFIDTFGWVGLALTLLGIVGLLVRARSTPGLASFVSLLFVGPAIGLALFSRVWLETPLALGILAPGVAVLGACGLSLLWHLKPAYLSRLVCVIVLAILAVSALQMTYLEDAAYRYDKLPLGIGAWIETQGGGSVAVRLSDSHRLLRTAAAAAFYAKRPLADGRFAHTPDPLLNSNFLITDQPLPDGVEAMRYARNGGLAAYQLAETTDTSEQN